MFFKNKQLLEEVERLRKDVESFHTVESELRAEMLYVELDRNGKISRVNDSFSDAIDFSSNDAACLIMFSILLRVEISNSDLPLPCKFSL